MTVVDSVGHFVSDDEVVLRLHRALHIVTDASCRFAVPCMERASGSVSEICVSSALASCASIAFTRSISCFSLSILP